MNIFVCRCCFCVLFDERGIVPRIGVDIHYICISIYNMHIYTSNSYSVGTWDEMMRAEL